MVYPKWVCENYSSDPAIKVDRERRIVLLPEGKVSSCCDLYDVNYNYSKFEASPFDENPVSDILGDFSKQSLEEILTQKDKIIVVQPFVRGIRAENNSIFDPSGRSFEGVHTINIIRNFKRILVLF